MPRLLLPAALLLALCAPASAEEAEKPKKKGAVRGTIKKVDPSVWCAHPVDALYREGHFRRLGISNYSSCVRPAFRELGSKANALYG